MLKQQHPNEIKDNPIPFASDKLTLRTESKAVVPSEIYTIHKSAIEKLSNEIPSLYIFIKSISEAALINKIKDNDFLNFGDSKTKYIEFVKCYPILAQQVPQQYIASYLKITAQSLSRIRKGMMKGK